MISIRMIKLCGDSIYKPLEMIFKFCLNQGIFPAETIPFQQVSSQKHLGLILETPSRFDEHIKAITSKVSKTIGLLRKLNNRLPRSSLTTIYKSFVRPHLDSHKKQKYSLETGAELAVLHTYVENQAILEPILLYRGSKCK